MTWDRKRMDETKQLFVEFNSLEHLHQQIDESLLKGRAYVLGDHELSLRQLCELILIHPLTGQWLPLRAEAVYIAPCEPKGVGVEIQMSAEQLQSILDDFVAAKSRSDAPSSSSSTPISPPNLGQVEVAADSTSEPLQLDQVALGEPSAASPPSDRQAVPAQSPAEKVRRLNAAGRARVAQRGTLAERVALERAYGPAVWDALLSNPMISTAEVARIAKNHTASQPILNQIASNSAWLVKPEVRRALLSNPRLPEHQIEKTLRALPHQELRLVLKQAAYSIRVRNAAKRMLGV